MAQKRKPDRADVIIIGAGASGATAAKVLTERGLRVVALERGPWRKRESFGGDELANVNRYNLWPDPILNPTDLSGVRPRRDENRAFLSGAPDGGWRNRALAGLASTFYRERFQTTLDRRRRSWDNSG